MRPFFGYHMPNFTFPGIPDTDLFDRTWSNWPRRPRRPASTW